MAQDLKDTKMGKLAKFFNDLLNTCSYRPMGLLSCCYKQLERLLHNRIGPAVDAVNPVEQAGFRSSYSSTDQVLSLTTHNEARFGRRLKTSDVTESYDTVCKLLRVIPCLKHAI